MLGAHRVGDDAVRRRTPCSGTGGRSTRSSSWASSCSRTWRSPRRTSCRTSSRSPRPRCSCSSRCTPSTSARPGSGGGSATRPRSRRSTCAAGRCSSCVALVGLAGAHPARRVGPAGRRVGRRRRPADRDRRRISAACSRSGGALRGGGGVSFGSTARISARWFSDDEIAFTATIPAARPRASSWRAATYDTFDLEALGRSPARHGGRRSRPARRSSRHRRGPVPGPDARRSRSRSRPDDYHDPPAPRARRADGRRPRRERAPVRRRRLVRRRRPARRARRRTRSTRRVLRPFEEDGITGNRLRAASEDYPADISARYTARARRRDRARTPTSCWRRSSRARQPTDPYDLAGHDGGRTCATRPVRLRRRT